MSIRTKSTQEGRKEILVEQSGSSSAHGAWAIAASNGSSSLQVVRRSASDGQEIIACDLLVWRSGWNARSVYETELELRILGVPLALAKLLKLKQALREWDCSLAEFSLDLSPETPPRKSLIFEIGEDPALIYSPDKPVCKIRYSQVGAATIDIMFVVDQSCIRICGDELELFCQEK